jgi:isoquinoline 1-oxidoreductase subunit alpha
MTKNLSINGTVQSIASEPEMPLLWVLREELSLTGTKYGCGIGVCGVCTVHLDGVAVPSCVLPVAQVEGAKITTIERLSKDGTLHPVQQAWLDAAVAQCGYCQTGMIMATAALLLQNSHPTEEAFTTGINVHCRCGTYVRVMRAFRALVSR